MARASALEMKVSGPAAPREAHEGQIFSLERRKPRPLKCRFLGSWKAFGWPCFGPPQVAGRAGALSGPRGGVTPSARWPRQNRLRYCLLRSQPGAVQRGPPPCLTQSLCNVGCARFVQPGRMHSRIACLWVQQRLRHLAALSQPSTLQSPIFLWRGETGRHFSEGAGGWLQNWCDQMGSLGSFFWSGPTERQSPPKRFG